MKREIATNVLQMGDHRVIVDAGSRAEAHWLGLGYVSPGETKTLKRRACAKK
ncbi:hypothetical protein D3C76_1545330 [compost metagenome]